MSLHQLVLVKFHYEYTTREGRQVSIKPNERYVLVAKTNDHWWYVRKDEVTKPFFIPAQYVTELPYESETTQLSGQQDGQDILNSPAKDITYSDTVPPVSLEVIVKDQKAIKTPNEKDQYGISMFVIPSDEFKGKSFENEPWEVKTEPMDLSRDGLTNSLPLVDGESTYAVSQKHIPNTTLQKTVTEPSEIKTDLNEDIQMLIRAGWDPKIWDLKEDHIYDSVDPVKDSVAQDTKDLPLISPVSPSCMSPPFSPQQSPGSPIDIPSPFADKAPGDGRSTLTRRAEKSTTIIPAQAVALGIILLAP